MDKVDVAGQASAQNDRGRITTSPIGVRPQLLGRQNPREERDNEMVNRLYSTMGQNRQFGLGASPTPTQSNRLTTRSQSTQGSSLQEKTLQTIGEEPNSLRFEKPNQHKKELSSQLSNHEIRSIPEGACIAQN
jgi:hypothetical protein